MATPEQIVTSTFSLAQNYAAAATTQLNTFAQALSDTVYAPPTFSVTWNSIAPPSLPSMPSAPSLPNIGYVAPSEPSAFTEVAPTITIDPFTEVAPTTNFPATPTVSYGSAPLIPAVGTVAVPDAPTLSMPTSPTYLSLTTPAFGGVDLHPSWLAQLENIPELVLAEPTPYYYSAGPEYTSALLQQLSAILNTRLAGGTGLSPGVEAAIWARSQSRETQLAQANIDEVTRTSDALGYMLPPGVLAAQLREAQNVYYDKVSTHSRDVAIKQAELEQDNLKASIEMGIRLEGQLIDYSYKLEQLSFESAKTAAENAIQAYNSQVEAYKAVLTGYQTYAMAYKTIIDGEMTKVEVYKAELAAEETKANINRTLVEQYKAQIDAMMSSVTLYRAQIDGARTLIELEQTKIQAAAEQIRGYVAQINAETAKVEAYKAGVQAEATKVEIYRIKTDAFAATTRAATEVARLRLEEYEAKARVKTQEWEGYKARVDAERSRMTALSAQSSALVEGYSAAARAVEAEATVATRVWEGEIKQYEAAKQVSISTAQLNNSASQFAAEANLNAAKVGAQVYAQLTSSAYSMMHTSAGINGAASMNVSYSYSNDTLSPVPPVTAI